MIGIRKCVCSLHQYSIKLKSTQSIKISYQGNKKNKKKHSIANETKHKLTVKQKQRGFKGEIKKCSKRNKKTKHNLRP
jgi:hypothetical protein